MGISKTEHFTEEQNEVGKINEKHFLILLELRL